MPVVVSAPELASRLLEAVVDLDTVNQPLTLLRLGGLAAVLLTAAWLSWLEAEPLPMLAAALVAGVAYALLAKPRLEFALSCLISWLMAWPFATYASLHLLHHRWNGRDPRDPERSERLSGPGPLPGSAWSLSALLAGDGARDGETENTICSASSMPPAPWVPPAG